ncbi:phosphotransferase [Microbacterium sp. A588]
MSANTKVSERDLLSEALGVSAATMTLHSKEPLGAGSVTGIEVPGAQNLLYYVDTSQITVAAETGWASEDTRVWMHPADPHLPALASISFDHAATALLERLGFTATSAPEFIAYRPGRRAVLRVAAGDESVWVKVVRPSRVESLVRAHTATADAGIGVPFVHGWSAEGLVIMSAAAGTPATDFAWEPETLLDETDRLRARFSSISWTKRSPGAERRIRWYESREVDGTADLLDSIRTLIGRIDGGRPRTVVHGDLHYGQLFLDDQGQICSVIDVDTLGIADPAEDAAAFAAHAIASARLTDAHNRARVWDLADGALARWGDDPLVRALTGVQLLGHLIAANDRRDADAADQLRASAHAVLDGRMPSTGAR